MAEDLTEGHAAEAEGGDRALTPEPDAPGWHPDPFGRLPYRWWDGSGWTAYAADTAVRWDAEPLEVVEPQQPGLPGFATALVAFVAGVGLSFAAHAVHRRAGTPGGVAAEIAVGSLGLWSALVLATVWVSRRRGSGSIVRDFAIRFRWSDLWVGFGGSLVARVASGMSVLPIPVPSRSLGEPDPGPGAVERGVEGVAAWVVLVIVVCIGAPVIEEIFFRGLLQPRLVDRFRAPLGIALASLLFGAAHLIAWTDPFTLAYAWAVAAGGVVLGIIRHHAGRVGPAIIAHAFFNAEALLVIALLR